MRNAALDRDAGTFTVPLSLRQDGVFSHCLFGRNENIRIIVVAGRINIDSARALLHADKSVCKVKRDVGYMLIDIFLNLLVIFLSLSLVSLANCLVKELHNQIAVIMSLVYCGTRL